MDLSAKRKMSAASVAYAAVITASLHLVSGPAPAGTSGGDERAAGRTPRPRVEVVFCLDTTGSMGGLIAGAQQKIWSIVNGIVSGKPVPDVRVGLVAYRDRGDEYVTRIVDLNSDLDAIHKALFDLKAEGGGDHPESVNRALNDAVTKISWSPKGEKVYRVIFLVGDAPPHMDYSDDIKYPDTCRAAVGKDIVVNTIRCGGDTETERVWRDIAARAEGQYASITQSGGVSVVSTPHDAKLAELSAKLVGTAIYFGDDPMRGRAEAARRRAAEDAERAAEGKADAKLLAIEADKGEFRAKAATAAMSAAPGELAETGLAGMGMGRDVGGADLVNAYAARGEEAIRSLKDESLPEDFRKLSPGERKALLEKKVAERRELQRQMEEISKLRAQYIRQEIEKKGGSGDKGFDAAVREMLRKQGSRRGIEYGTDEGR
ncbi:MAG: VWA domain-containing protein [Planctomycetota bacterium]|nr:VWA domain-containing protein [Planctomycetota bacterium]